MHTREKVFHSGEDWYVDGWNLTLCGSANQDSPVWGGTYCKLNFNLRWNNNSCALIHDIHFQRFHSPTKLKEENLWYYTSDFLICIVIEEIKLGDNTKQSNLGTYSIIYTINTISNRNSFPSLELQESWYQKCWTDNHHIVISLVTSLLVVVDETNCQTYNQRYLWISATGRNFLIQYCYFVIETLILRNSVVNWLPI